MFFGGQGKTYGFGITKTNRIYFDFFNESNGVFETMEGEEISAAKKRERFGILLMPH